MGIHLSELLMGLDSLAEETASSPKAMACIVTCVNAGGMEVGKEQPDIIQNTISDMLRPKKRTQSQNCSCNTEQNHKKTNLHSQNHQMNLAEI